MRVHQYPLKGGIMRTKEFEKKRLASFAVNVGTKCGHDCLYCSTGAVLRMHPSFKAVGENPFGHGYCIVDPATPERVARDAARHSERGLVQLCTLTDAWAPEAKAHELGRRCLEAILAEPDWSIRILTKNASVTDDFDLIERHRDRVLVGVSLTATRAKANVTKVLEPNASSILDRMVAMAEAAARGLRTYAMLCPLLPGVADAPANIDQLVEISDACHVEEIFVEAVNARGTGLHACQAALQEHGDLAEAEAMGAISTRDGWSRYARDLIFNVQESVRRYSDLGKLRVLLYPSRLLPEHVEEIRTHGAGVIWLGKDKFQGEPAAAPSGAAECEL